MLKLRIFLIAISFLLLGFFVAALPVSAADYFDRFAYLNVFPEPTYYQPKWYPSDLEDENGRGMQGDGDSLKYYISLMNSLRLIVEYFLSNDLYEDSMPEIENRMRQLEYSWKRFRSGAWPKNALNKKHLYIPINKFNDWWSEYMATVSYLTSLGDTSSEIILDLQKENSDLKTRINHLLTDISSLEEESLLDNLQINRLKDEVASLENQLALQLEEYSRLLEAYDELYSLNTSFITEGNRLRREIESLKIERDRLKAERDRANAEKDSANAQRDSANAEISDLKDTISDLETDIENLNEEILFLIYGPESDFLYEFQRDDYEDNVTYTKDPVFGDLISSYEGNLIVYDIQPGSNLVSTFTNTYSFPNLDKLKAGKRYQLTLEYLDDISRVHYVNDYSDTYTGTAEDSVTYRNESLLYFNGNPITFNDTRVFEFIASEQKRDYIFIRHNVHVTANVSSNFSGQIHCIEGIRYRITIRELPSSMETGMNKVVDILEDMDKRQRETDEAIADSSGRMQEEADKLIGEYEEAESQVAVIYEDIDDSFTELPSDKLENLDANYLSSILWVVSQLERFAVSFDKFMPIFGVLVVLSVATILIGLRRFWSGGK